MKQVKELSPDAMEIARRVLYTAIVRYQSEKGCTQKAAYEFCEKKAKAVYGQSIFATYKSVRDYKNNHPNVVEDAVEDLTPRQPRHVSGEIESIFKILSDSIPLMREMCKNEGLGVMRSEEDDTLAFDEDVRFIADTVNSYSRHLPEKALTEIQSHLKNLTLRKTKNEARRNRESKRATKRYRPRNA
jgi:hypothetical protein